MTERDNSRAKMLGNLIREARLHRERTVTECAQVLDVSPEAFEEMETGDRSVSLPDLEALAVYLKIPMGYFWGNESLPQEPQVDYRNLTELRQRMVGVVLRQLRLQARLSPEELAEELDVDVERITAYEGGDVPIPYLHLEQLSRYLDARVDHFLSDQYGPLRRNELERQLQKQFKQMSPDMQEFIANPRNIVYIETAKRLSEMDVNKLRQVAENILEITF
jgi:transcriptional regulator with XRE-family HTH domain